MVRNTATQMIESGDMRSVIIVGAGHVHGMMEAFAKYYPDIKVVRYNDMPNNKGKVSPSDNIKRLTASK